MQRRSRLALSPVALVLLASSGLGCFGIAQDKSKGNTADSGTYCLVTDAGADVSADGSVSADGAAPDLLSCSSYCPPPRPSVTTPVDRRAKDLLGQLTLDEKIQMMSGGSSCTRGIWNSDFNSTGVSRLNIPDWRMSDGRAACTS
jgi:hypothetical protein